MSVWFWMLVAFILGWAGRSRIAYKDLKSERLEIERLKIALCIAKQDKHELERKFGRRDLPNWGSALVDSDPNDYH